MFDEGIWGKAFIFYLVFSFFRDKDLTDHFDVIFFVLLSNNFIKVI